MTAQSPRFAPDRQLPPGTVSSRHWQQTSAQSPAARRSTDRSSTRPIVRAFAGLVATVAVMVGVAAPAGPAQAATAFDASITATTHDRSAAGISAVEYFLISNLHSAKCLDVSGRSGNDRAAVVQYTCDPGKTNQQWTLQSTGDGYFRIIVAHSGKCLDIWNSSQDPTADAIQYTCSPTKYNQQFRQEFTTGGFARFVARHSGQCLDVDGASLSNKAQVHQDFCDGSRPSQEWLVG